MSAHISYCLKRGSTRFLTVVVVLLVILAAGQGFALYNLYKRINQPAPAREVPDVSPPIFPSGPSGSRYMPSVPPGPPHVNQPRQTPAVRDFLDAWDPMEDIERMRQHMDQLLGSATEFFRGEPNVPGELMMLRPDIDIHDEGDHYLIRMDIPGYDKSEINVTIEDRVLTATGRSEKTAREEQAGRVIRSERRHGQFQRSILLPGPVQSEQMQARYENGVLILTVPKASGGGTSRPVEII